MTEHETEHSGAVAIGPTEQQVETALITWFSNEVAWDKGMAPWSAEKFRAEMRATLAAALAAEPIRQEPVERIKAMLAVDMDAPLNAIDRLRCHAANTENVRFEADDAEEILEYLEELTASPPRQEPVDPTPVSRAGGIPVDKQNSGDSHGPDR